MKSLVLFGDSLLAYCHKSEEIFFADQLNGQYEMYNCATGGLDSTDLSRRAPFIGKLQSDVVLVSVGTNDACPWKQVDIETFKANLAPITDAFANSRIIYMPPPPVVEDKRPSGKEIHNKTMHEYNNAVTDFCKSRDIKYWDTWTDLSALLGSDKDPHDEDGVHFSDVGYEFVLTRLAEVVKS